MAEAPKSYRVVAPYITVKTMTPDGMQIRGLHAGAMVPPDVTPESIGHHVTLGLRVGRCRGRGERAQQHVRPGRERVPGPGGDLLPHLGQRRRPRLHPSPPLGPCLAATVRRPGCLPALGRLLP